MDTSTATSMRPTARRPAARAVSGGRGAAARRVVWGWMLLTLALPGFAAGSGAVAPQKVEAAFLRNFARYVTWPSEVFPNTTSPWKICILGDDPFGDVLELTLEGRTEQGRAFEVHRAAELADVPPCQIVFVAIRDPLRRRAALRELGTRPVLTVGDDPGFLRDGGIIRFQVSDRVEMSVNLDQARSVSLKIQTKMLEVSRDVLENGAMRRLK